MKSRYMIAVGAALLVVIGVTIAQQPKVAPLPPPTDYSPVNPVVPPTYTPPQGQSVARKPEDMTLEQLLDAVDGFRAEKAELEKKEKTFMKVVHQKAGKLKERIDGLNGVLPPPMAPSVPTPSIVPGGAPPAFPPAPGPLPMP